MPEPATNQQWADFLEEWPAERIGSMSLKEFATHDDEGSFVHWLEERTGGLGSIGDVFPIKFGIYSRSVHATAEVGDWVSQDDDFCWERRFGKTAELAFSTIRDRLVEVATAAQQGNLERIDGVDVFWPIAKWKVAFLYQNRSVPCIFPVFRHENLFDHYLLAVPGAKRNGVHRATMYPTLLDHYSECADIFEVARVILADGGKSRSVRYWAVPLHDVMPEADAAKLCELKSVGQEDLPRLVQDMLEDANFHSGDEIALLIKDSARAVGKLVAAEPGAYAWSQSAVNVVADLTVIPSEVCELDAFERGSIWGEHLPEAAREEIEYWKISPGKGAELWDQCRKGNFIAAWWPKFGDLSNISIDEFRRRRGELMHLQFYQTERVQKVWQFRNIPVGSKVVANDGIYSVLGVGTVTGPYEYHDDGSEYPHRLPVQWEDTGTLRVNRPDWYPLLVKLTKDDFLNLSQRLQQDEKAMSDDELAVSPVNLPHETQALILYGPPGTGKTWTTMTRALEIIFPGADLSSWSEDTRAHHFRDCQRRGQIEFVTFHQAYGYEEFVEGIRPVMAQGVQEQSRNASDQVHYEIHSGVFKRIAFRAASEGLRVEVPPGGEESHQDRVQKALDRPHGGSVEFGFTKDTPPYVLIIDEINRGNVSKILGELITLLEPDKRIGAVNELKLPLAYSPQHRFAVPPNLHVIGTMNTADRSIALLDVALRRRFRFEEVEPDSDIIRGVLSEKVSDAEMVDLVCEVFDALNGRIRLLFDRDHQIGHAYFLKVRDLFDLRDVFADHVIPLLQEYFYGAWERVCAALGCPYDEDGKPLRTGSCLDTSSKQYLAPLVEATIVDSQSLLGNVSDEYETSIDFRVSPAFRPTPSHTRHGTDELLAFFLGMLDLDEESRRDREDRLSGVVEE